MPMLILIIIQRRSVMLTNYLMSAGLVVNNF